MESRIAQADFLPETPRLLFPRPLLVGLVSSLLHQSMFNYMQSLFDREFPLFSCCRSKLESRTDDGKVWICVENLDFNFSIPIVMKIFSYYG